MNDTFEVNVAKSEEMVY